LEIPFSFFMSFSYEFLSSVLIFIMKKIEIRVHNCMSAPKKR
jgi:hypothetical protein